MTLIRCGVFFKYFLVSATTFLSPYTSLGMEYQTQTLSFVLVTIQKSGARKHRIYQPYPVYVFTIIGGHHFIPKEAILGYKGSHTQQKRLTFYWLGHWCPPPTTTTTTTPTTTATTNTNTNTTTTAITTIYLNFMNKTISNTKQKL